jgi:hypothetical protein
LDPLQFVASDLGELLRLRRYIVQVIFGDDGPADRLDSVMNQLAVKFGDRLKPEVVGGLQLLPRFTRFLLRLSRSVAPAHMGQ